MKNVAVEEDAMNYHVMKVCIKTYLKLYKEMLVDYERELKEYREDETFHFMIELKKEHVDTVKGKIEILIDLNEK